MNWIMFAQTAGGTGTTPAPGGLGPMFWTMIVPLGGLFVVFYFLLIRPQKKQEKARREMISALEKNDKVVTIGGIHGTVATVRDKDVILKVDESSNTRIRVSRSSISRIVTTGSDEFDNN